MTDEIRLDGRVIIVTGAGRGLGRAYAHLLAARGALVAVNDLPAEAPHALSEAAKVVAEIEEAGGRAVAVEHDITSVAGAKAMTDAVVARFGHVDGLVHNAGILRDRTMHKTGEADVRDVFAIHTEAAFWVLMELWPMMRERKFGRVVLTTSSSGLFGTFGQANYAAAKMALVGAMRVLALEGARYGICVNCVAPSARTRMTEDLLGPLADKLDPAEVAPLIAYLMSEGMTLTNRIFSAGGGRFASAFMGLAPGWVRGGEEPASPEDIAAHMDEILDPAGHIIPQSGEDELAVMLKALNRE